MGKYTIRLTGFQPDNVGPALNSGSFIFGKSGANQIIPTRAGYEVGSGRDEFQTMSVPTFTAGTAIAGFGAEFLNSFKDNYIATTKQLYRLDTVWTSVGRATTYSGASNTAPWDFTVFENYVFATNVADGLQYATPNGTFADVSGSPKFAFVENVNQFLIAASGQTSGNQWACSALGNPLSWAPSVTTQAATGTLTSVPGPIVGIKGLGDEIVIYKRDGFYLGRYVGAANNTWAFEAVSKTIGALSHQSIVNIGYAHIFPSKDDFYIYDGTRPVRLHCPLFKWWTRKANSTYKLSGANILGVVDRERSLIYWGYTNQAGVSSLNLQWALVFNYEKPNSQEAWGIATIASSTIFNWAGSAAFSADNVPVGVTSFSGSIKYLYSPDTSSTTQGIWSISPIGDVGQFQTLKRITPHWIVPPLNATANVAIRNGLTIDNTTSGATPAVSSMTFINGSGSASEPEHLDVLLSSRIFDITMTIQSSPTATGEFSEITLEFEDDGTE